MESHRIREIPYDFTSSQVNTSPDRCKLGNGYKVYKSIKYGLLHDASSFALRHS